ncbi:hypothetical protein GDO78_000136 [Eleutherodactylus coqui]|uniref:Tetraspanin n=1 Tax=Eleutherodactylus coqui TaxID=57060 RepID=A0A8J6FNZ7_ELECQ|nr:hypothetical protein GDO78_000136 [Eleutherodactylus coqui]
MAVEGGMKCVKYLVFIFNFLFWIAGCALIGVGIYVLVQMPNLEAFKNFSASGPAIVIIAVGVVIFFISFFGCCGAVKENYCMVTTFAILLGLIFLVEIAAAIAGYIYRNQLHDALDASFRDSMKGYNSTKETSRVINDLQKDLKCCGANSSQDWANYDPFKGTKFLPDSCCKNITTNCGRSVSNPNNFNNEGCVNKVEGLFKNNIPIVAGVALGIAFFEILGIVFACCLMKGIRSGYEVM